MFLKKEVLDPQGRAVQKALSKLGFDSVRDVRVGKAILLETEHQKRDEAINEIDNMCKKILANPVIEDYEIEILEE